MVRDRLRRGAARLRRATQMARDQLSTQPRRAASRARSVGEQVGERATRTGRRAVEGGRDVAERAGERARRTPERVADTSREAATRGAEGVRRAGERAADEGREVASRARGRASDAGEQVTDQAGRGARQVAGRSAQQTARTLDVAERGASEVAGQSAQQTAAIVGVGRSGRDRAASFSDDVLDPQSAPGPTQQVFGAEQADREQAMAELATDGSVGGAIFTGGRAIELGGQRATERLDDAVPDVERGPAITGRSIGEAAMSLDPRRLDDPDGTPAAQQVRNVAVSVPAGVGLLGGLGPRATGDVLSQAERVVTGRDVPNEATMTAGETGRALRTGGENVLIGVAEEPVGAFAAGVGPTAAGPVARGARSGARRTRESLPDEPVGAFVRDDRAQQTLTVTRERQRRQDPDDQLARMADEQRSPEAFERAAEIELRDEMGDIPLEQQFSTERAAQEAVQTRAARMRLERRVGGEQTLQEVIPDAMTRQREIQRAREQMFGDDAGLQGQTQTQTQAQMQAAQTQRQTAASAAARPGGQREAMLTPDARRQPSADEILVETVGRPSAGETVTASQFARPEVAGATAATAAVPATGETLDVTADPMTQTETEAVVGTVGPDETIESEIGLEADQDVDVALGVTAEETFDADLGATVDQGRLQDTTVTQGVEAGQTVGTGLDIGLGQTTTITTGGGMGQTITTTTLPPGGSRTRPFFPDPPEAEERDDFDADAGTGVDEFRNPIVSDEQAFEVGFGIGVGVGGGDGDAGVDLGFGIGDARRE